MEEYQRSELLEVLLQRLSEGPTVPVEGKLVTIEEVFMKVLDMLKEENLCACHIFELIQAAVGFISGQYTGDNTLQIIKEQTQLGVLLLEVISRYVTHEGLAVTSDYENLCFLAVSLLTTWRSGLYEVEGSTLLSPLLKMWIVHIMKRPFSCPNALLRLEMIRLIAMWTVEDLKHNIELATHITAGMLHNIPDLKVTFLLPKGHIGLLWSLKESLQLLHVSGFFGWFMMRSIYNIRHLVVDRNEKAMAYLVVLMGRAAKRVVRLRQSGDLTHVGTVDQLTNILCILRLLVATPPNVSLYEEGGMCRIAASAIALTCRCIMQIPDAPVSRRIYRKLVLEVNDFFRVLEKFQKEGTVLEELRRYHGRSLSFVGARMEKLGFTDHNVPEPLQEMEQNVPFKFFEWRTMRVLQTPLKLISGEVIDKGTLLVLMLSASFQDHVRLQPHDLTYDVMPELQDELRVWKEQQKKQQQKKQQQQGEKRLEPHHNQEYEEEEYLLDQEYYELKLQHEQQLHEQEHQQRQGYQQQQQGEKRLEPHHNQEYEEEEYQQDQECYELELQHEQQLHEQEHQQRQGYQQE